VPVAIEGEALKDAARLAPELLRLQSPDRAGDDRDASRASGAHRDRRNREIVRDEHGNAWCGIRLSYIEVPLATYVARSPEGDMWRGMIGQQIPFPEKKLSRLYPTHDAYVTMVKESVESLRRDRWLFPQDADELIADAALAPCPKSRFGRSFMRDSS
jgi:Alpha/beta hydrolase domain